MPNAHSGASRRELTITLLGTWITKKVSVNLEHIASTKYPVQFFPSIIREGLLLQR